MAPSTTSTTLTPALALTTLLFFFPSVCAALAPRLDADADLNPSPNAGPKLTDPAGAIVFPKPYPEAFRTLSVLISLLGVSVLSFCCARRITGFTLDAPPSRWILIATFIDSWIFIFAAALMISGVGLSFNQATCRGAIYLCIVFYASSKVLVYTFLAERVHAVHPGLGRLRSTAYRICLAFLTGYVVIIVLMLWGRISFLRDGTTHRFPYTTNTMDGSDNACVIGLVTPTSLALLIYDLILNVLFTCLFLHPLYRSSYKLTHRLRRLARRTLAAAAVALVTSAVNMVVLTVMHGQQLGWLCLGSCGTDVTINALALYFVTGPVDESASIAPFDHAASPPSKRQSANGGLRKPTTPKTPQPLEDAPQLTVSYASNKGNLTNYIHPTVVSQPQRTVHFPGTPRTDGSDISEYEMSDKIDVTNPAQLTPGFLMNHSGLGEKRRGEDSKHQGRDTDAYLVVNGMAPDTARKRPRRNSDKRFLDIAAAVHDSETPRCSTPEGESTEVQVRTEGPPPRPKVRSQSRSGRPASSSSRRLGSSHGNREGQGDGAGAFVSKVAAIFRSNDTAPPPSTSMVVNVKTLTEEHTDATDPDQSRWNTLKKAQAAQAAQAFVETGV